MDKQYKKVVNWLVTIYLILFSASLLIWLFVFKDSPPWSMFFKSLILMYVGCQSFKLYKFARYALKMERKEKIQFTGHDWTILEIWSVITCGISTLVGFKSCILTTVLITFSFTLYAMICKKYHI
mgnify:CR=1 FL=1